MVDTNIRFCQDTDSQPATSFTESDGVVVHPSVGVPSCGVVSGDSAGEGGGVSHHNPCASRCDLYLWWYYIGERMCIVVDQRVHKTISILNEIAEYISHLIDAIVQPSQVP